MGGPGLAHLGLGTLDGGLGQARNRAQKPGLFGVLRLALGKNCGIGVRRGGVLRQLAGVGGRRLARPLLGMGQLLGHQLQALALVVGHNSQGNDGRQQHAQHPVHEHTAVPDQPASI